MEGIVSSEFPVQPKVRETTVSFFFKCIFFNETDEGDICGLGHGLG